MSQAPGGRPELSADGRWYWDGAQWRSLVSPDGRSVWNGQAWVPLAPTAPAPEAGPARPDWLPAESWTVVRPREDAPAQAAAPAGPDPAAAAPATAPPAPAFRVRDLFPMERMFPVALFLICAIIAGQWWWSHQPQAVPPAVLVAKQSTLLYHTGDTLRFTVIQEQHGRLTLPNGHQGDSWDKIQAVEDWRVIDVAPDGTTTVGIKFESLSGQIDGVNVRFNPARAQEAKLVVHNDGRVVSGGTNGSAGAKASNSVPASDQFFSVLPDHDVKAGDSWSTTWKRPNPLGSGTVTYSSTSTFKGYDTLQQFGSCAVIRTVETLPIDVGLDIRALLALTGDDAGGIPAGATVTYKGSADGDTTTYVDMASRLPVHMLDVSNFSFDEAYSGLPNTPEFAPLMQGKFHWAGHQQGSMDLIELPKHTASA